ncbi:hypothetical protein [Afipia sp. Root123D2]|uniref:hypothetical protein n=1 Tax=Afipia sp. Root123D2 TaxID=1736436 RepID=UPI000AA4533E|nr:hypothetical protein [Afipia sp. Root123D2]
MNGAAPATSHKSRAMIWTLVGAGLLLLVAANSHLVYVATTSQPDCVTHVRRGETATSGQYSAASSSCSPARSGG